MADFNSSLPVRTQNNGDVVINIADGTTETQLLAVSASGALTLTSAGSASGGTAAGVSELVGAIYNSTPPTLTNGQQASLQLDSSGNLKVNVAAGTISTGSVDESTFTAGTSTFNPAGGAFNDSLSALTSGQQGESRITSFRALHVNLRNNSGTEIGTSANPIVDNLAQVGGSAIALGQTTMSASLPVAIASNQSAILVTQSTSPWVTSDLADGSPTGGTAGTKSLLAGGIYNTTLPTLTNGQQAGLQFDSNGKLLIDGSTVTQPVSGTVTANQGTPNTLANAWTMEITDGTHGPAAVKAASTAAVATDPSLVVALSPNSPLPAGTNVIGALSANQSVNLTEVGGSAIALGQTTMSASIPVAIASNQSTLNTNVYIGGNPASASNPVPVTITNASSGTPIQNYQTSASLAAGSSVTLTYTVPATHTFSLERVWTSGSGKIKTVLQNNGSTIFVGFNSTANPNIDMVITAPPSVAAGNTVSVTITNEDKAAFDVYATIEGNQVS